MDPIKEAFFRIKEDISVLNEAVLALKEELNELKIQINEEKITYSKPQHPTHNPTQTPTLPQEAEGLYLSKTPVSTGNRGVPTDTSTDKPTHVFPSYNEQNTPQNAVFNYKNRITTFSHPSHEDPSFQKANELLASLDSVRKEIRLKFKQLTAQEMLVFSTIYQLEEQQAEVSHKTLASFLSLSESSIRDYVNRLILKGIPIKKLRKNNKSVLLSVSNELKKIASLSTIIRLREI